MKELTPRSVNKKTEVKETTELPLDLKTDEKGLLGEIIALKPGDDGRSKSTIYQKVLEAAEQGDIEPAKALKEFWITINEWEKTSKKQQKKVQDIKNILKE